MFDVIITIAHSLLDVMQTSDDAPLGFTMRRTKFERQAVFAPLISPWRNSNTTK
jgi:hypothetical protein